MAMVSVTIFAARGSAGAPNARLIQAGASIALAAVAAKSRRVSLVVTPSNVFDYNVPSGKSILLKQQEVRGAFDPKQYVSERQWAVARDGTKVPISVVYKKGFEQNGKGAVLLYAYGSYGTPTSVTFSSSRLSLLDRNVPYAIARIRGRNEMGEQWREDGRMMKKKNTFNDFVDCARYLIGEKWASPSKLIIEGGSRQ